MNTKIHGGVWVMILCCGVLLIGCGSREKAAEVTEKAIERSIATEGGNAAVTVSPDGQNVSVTIRDEHSGQTTMEMRTTGEDASMVVTGEDGQVVMTTGASAGIPEGFPKDVPLHSSAQVNMSLTDGGTGFTIQATTGETFNNIVTFYKEESVKQGWSEQMNMQQNLDSPMQMLSYQKDRRIMNVVIQQEGAKVNITLTVANE